MAKVYVATSWRNDWQPHIVEFLRENGHEVYDFRHPHQTGEDRGRMGKGFSWDEIDHDWRDWTPAQYLAILKLDVARNGFLSDHDAIQWCDVLVMVMPCGLSAGLELGLAVGYGKRTAVLVMPGYGSPDLMVLSADLLSESPNEVEEWITNDEP